MSTEFNRYSEFEDWAYENGYDPEAKFNETEESHKRDTLLTFYMENSINGSWACVTVVCSYDHGWRDVEVTEDLHRKAIVTTQYTYEAW